MNKLVKPLYLSAIYFFFYLPIAIVVIYSFNDTSYSLLWHGFTTHWYNQLFHDRSLFIVTLHSLIIATLAASIASLIGTLTATSLFRYKFLGRKLLHGLIFILLLAPDIATATSLLLFYDITKIALGFWSLLLAHITFCMPFVTIMVYSRITTLDKNLFEAAKDLGAGEFTIFLKIIIPLMWPAIISGWLLSFMLSLDDVIISFFVTGPNFSILPLHIYSMVRLGVSPEINALSSILLATTLLFVIISQLVLRKKQ